MINKVIIKIKNEKNVFQLLFALLFCLNFFDIKSQKNNDCFFTNECSHISIKIHEKTGKIAYYNNQFCFDCNDCNVFDISNHQIEWIDSDKGLGLYSPSFPNLWFENGKIKRELVLISDSILAYNHYDENSQLIGQEFFTHDLIKREFFKYVGQWWRIINGVKTDVEYPDYHDDEFYDY